VTTALKEVPTKGAAKVVRRQRGEPGRNAPLADDAADRPRRQVSRHDVAPPVHWPQDRPAALIYAGEPPADHERGGLDDVDGALVVALPDDPQRAGARVVPLDQCCRGLGAPRSG